MSSAAAVAATTLMASAPDPVAAQALIFAREVRQLQALRREYERLVPVGLDLGSARGSLATLRDATVLFTDVRGFTGLAEHFADDPMALMEVVNEHLGAVVGALTECGGVIEKYVGDGVMATFGARGDLPRHQEAAVAAAFGVIYANDTLNRRRAEAWGFRLEVGVGVAAGCIAVGRVGPPERAEMGVLGDTVNVAARLVAQAGPGEVLLDASAYCDQVRMVAAEDLGPVALRGRSRQIEARRIRLLGA